MISFLHAEEVQVHRFLKQALNSNNVIKKNVIIIIIKREVSGLYFKHCNNSTEIGVTSY